MGLEEISRLNRIMERRRFGMRPGLETITAVLAELGNPQNELRFIHVAGTNGKGATCAMLDEVLRSAGYRVGRYTSPHLVTINERFFLDGRPAADAPLMAAAEKVLDVVDRLERERGIEVTFFETLTALAFVFYAEMKPDVVVLETGLGGRFDATNVVTTTLVSVITRIGLDHCDWLGTTHAAIAGEKAGIIKPGCPVVCGATPASARDVITRTAAEKGCPCLVADEHVTVASLAPLVLVRGARRLPPIRFALTGTFQAENAQTVLTVVDALVAHAGFVLRDADVVKGLERVVWPGRCQKIVAEGVTVFVDGAHNPDGATALCRALKSVGVGAAKSVGLIAGYCGDKDVLAHLRVMRTCAAQSWATPIRNARSMASDATAACMREAGFTRATACASFADAWTQALAWAKAKNGTLVVCGSLFLAGEALVALNAFPWLVRAPDANESSLHPSS